MEAMRGTGSYSKFLVPGSWPIGDPEPGTGTVNLLVAVAVVAATLPANFIYNTFLPYHEGASRYYPNLSAAGALRSD